MTPTIRPRRTVVAVLVTAVGVCLASVVIVVAVSVVDRTGDSARAGGAASAVIPHDMPLPRTSPSTTPPPRAPLTGRTVVLDPGHNRDNALFPAEINRLVDAGGFLKPCNTTGTATNDGIPEATLNWELALALQVRLEDRGATVILTRNANAGWGPCIDERAAIANRAGAGLLLSLHGDGAAAAAHGFHVIQPGVLPGYTDDIAADSQRAALDVRDALVAAGLSPSTYIGSQGLDVRTDLGTLNRADVPAVMLEAGNLRNADDAALLTGAAGRARIADALTAAIIDFLNG
jgi:N-acetylmuramoyl-L-alanine amidase